MLALKGAETILMPASLTDPTSSLFETWRVLSRARAIESFAYTACCANVTGPDRRGIAMICSPEEILVDAGGEGIFLATFGLDRVRWLREEEDRRVEGPPPWRTKPGNLRDRRRQDVLDRSPILSYASAGDRLTHARGHVLMPQQPWM